MTATAARPSADVGYTHPTARNPEVEAEVEVDGRDVVADQRKGSKDAADILMTLLDTSTTAATAKSRSVVARRKSLKQEVGYLQSVVETESSKVQPLQNIFTLSKEMQHKKDGDADDDHRDVGDDHIAQVSEVIEGEDLRAANKEPGEEATSKVVGKEVSSNQQEDDSGYEKEEEEEDEEEAGYRGAYHESDGEDCDRDEEDKEEESCSSQSSHSRSYFFSGCYNHLCNRDAGHSHQSASGGGIMSTDSTTRTRGSTAAFSYPPMSITSNNNSTTFRTRSVASLSFFSSSFDHDDDNRQDTADNETALLEEAVEQLTKEKRRAINKPLNINEQRHQEDEEPKFQQQMIQQEVKTRHLPKDPLPVVGMDTPSRNERISAKDVNQKTEAADTSFKTMHIPNFSAVPSASRIPRISSVRSSSSHPTPFTPTRRDKSTKTDSSLQTEQRDGRSDERNLDDQTNSEDDDEQPILVTLPSQQDQQDEIMSHDNIIDDTVGHEDSDEVELQKMIRELKRMKERVSKRHHPYLHHDGNDDLCGNDESMKTLQNMIDDLEGMKFVIQSNNPESTPIGRNITKNSKNRRFMKFFVSGTGGKSLFRDLSRKNNINKTEIKVPVNSEFPPDNVSSNDRRDDFRPSPSSPKKGCPRERHRWFKARGEIFGARIRRRKRTEVSANHVSPKSLRGITESNNDCDFVEDDDIASGGTNYSIEIVDQPGINLDLKNHTLSDHNSEETDQKLGISDSDKTDVDDAEKGSSRSSEIFRPNTSTMEKTTHESAENIKVSSDEVEGFDILDNLCENIEKHLCRGGACDSADARAEESMVATKEQTLQKVPRYDNNVNDRDNGIFIPHKGPPIATGVDAEFVKSSLQKACSKSCLPFVHTTNSHDFHVVVGDANNNHSDNNQSEGEEMYVEMTLFEIALMMVFGGQDVSSITNSMESQLNERMKETSGRTKNGSCRAEHVDDKNSKTSGIDLNKDENGELVSRIADIKERSLLDVPSMCEETSRFMEVEFVSDQLEDDASA